jgi:hypothetical protein
LPRLLDSTSWVAERIVVDMESSDDTVALARAAGCRVLSVEVAGCVDGVRNRFLGEAAHEWILVLDSDEYLADDAATALAELLAKHGQDVDAFAIPRYNHIAGHVMRGSGWYPDHQIRLFRRGCVAWHDGNHRRPTVLTGDDRLRLLEPPSCLHIHHTNYENLRAVIERQVAYALAAVYDADPARYDFNAYVAQAYEEFDARWDPEADGQLSTALATIMAWDRIVRGLIHWDRLDRRPSLHDAFSLPIVTRPSHRERDLETELARLRSHFVWRGYLATRRLLARAVPFRGARRRASG